jgi:hypothetical protein
MLVYVLKSDTKELQKKNEEAMRGESCDCPCHDRYDDECDYENEEVSTDDLVN